MRRAVLFGLLGVILLGCSGKGGDNPVGPSSSDAVCASVEQATASSGSRRYLIGLWDILVSQDRQSAEVVPRRVSQMHLNAVRLLQEEPCKDCIEIRDVRYIAPGDLRVLLILHHPYPYQLRYLGFDARGIIITGANYSFPQCGRSISWGEGAVRLLNPDGYTALFNPTEFPETKPGPPALRYIPGHYSPGGDLSATLNPFIAYSKSQTRRYFDSVAYGYEWATYKIRLPDGINNFGYAVDANWQLVEGEIENPLEDYPPDANCLEAYKIRVLPLERELGPAAGSSSPFGVEIYDHQGLDTISSVTIEAPDLFAGAINLAYEMETCDGGFLYTGAISNQNGAGPGNYPLLVRVVDIQEDQNLGPVDAWQVHQIGIRDGWVRNWGNCGVVQGYDVMVDPYGYVYVSGVFVYGVTDFDPGPGLDEHIGNQMAYDAYVSKFSPLAEHLWTRTWGDIGRDEASAICSDNIGNIYVTGHFGDEVDFDPGPAIDLHVANGEEDVYLSKLTPSGEHLWTRSWGGSSRDSGNAIAIDPAGNTHITGHFIDTVDFDPGPGVDEHTSAGKEDIFLSKFNSSGEFQWARTVGDELIDKGLAVATDGLGNAYVTGSIDFDPTLDIGNTFLAKVNPDGVIQFVRTWESHLDERSNSIAVDDTGIVYVSGAFSGLADFEPGPGVEHRTSNGTWDAFLSWFDTDGNFIQVLTWGGSGYDSASGVITDNVGNVFVHGECSYYTDFDPGPDVFELPFAGSVYFSRFKSDASFVWARSWGKSSADPGDIAIDGLDSVYVTGSMSENADFDPGRGVEMYEAVKADAYLMKLRTSDGYW